MYDVLVIGSGIAGLSAALSAHEAGAGAVLVAESEGIVGGSSRLSGGIVMGAGTAPQRAVGIEDNGAELFRDYMALNQWKLDAGVVQRFCAETGEALDWLIGLGVEFHQQLVFGGDERVPRCVRAVERGQGIIDVLHRRCRDAGIDIALGRRVDRLLLEGGRVVGAAVGDDEVRAGAVIVATGGFGTNEALLAELYPAALNVGDWRWYIGADGARGDHVGFAAQIGAQLAGHGRGLRLLHANFVNVTEPYLPGWTILVDADGRRFVDETAPYGIMDGVLSAHGDRAWVIFDDAGLRPAAGSGVVSFKQAIPGREMVSANWNPIMVDEMVTKGRMFRADTIEELAGAAGLPAAHVLGTVERYNEGAVRGVDDFAKAAKFLQPLATGPFYAAEVRPATLCFTACGLRIDRDAKVLDDDGRVIPGLFAAGECTGSVVGERYMGSGNSLGNGLTMGRIAGREAVARG
jgi:fumarate reductase flavoprotein subunit